MWRWRGGAEKAPDTDGETTATSLMRSWYPYGEHAPLYYSMQDGIFAEHGINLTITAGQGSTKTAQAAGSNKTEFGWADSAAVMSNTDKGVRVKSLGVFLQTTPSAVQIYADGPSGPPHTSPARPSPSPPVTPPPRRSRSSSTAPESSRTR
ncbi:ABC transporter substrate-binding protein [Rhodococcus sp. BP-316]|uniref:ABC transporter substrate-binding protein n=1 Tax=Rhodococcus sp. BP-316 TaxID=2739445 RepID=UPI0021C09E92|nr:ABC transporter substrate-binding protein [Rhodococcus sp. BP-316]